MEGRTHRPIYDPARCLPCSICVERCPSVRYPEYRRDPTLVRGVVSGCSARLPVRDDVPPCRAACPLHQDVPGYARPVRQLDPLAALEVIRATNPLPGVCGTVCNRSCERACVRARVDQGVTIRALKRYVVDCALGPAAGRRDAPLGRASGPLDVAVVGAGPAGLAAAHDLAASGFGVTVYDENPVPGGMLATAIPSFVMPRRLLQADLDVIRDLGVEFRTGVRVGREVQLASMRKAYRAVLLALGAGKGRPLGAKGETETPGVVDHVVFAREASLGKPAPLAGPAVVIGGGPAALQCARIARRLGADPVTVLFSRPLERLPADAEALEEAAEEGVRLEASTRVVEFVAEQGRLSGVRCEGTAEAEADAWGHRPLRRAGEARVVPARTAIVAVDREADLGALEGMSKVARTPLGFVAVEPGSLMTAEFGLFAAGDAVSGPKTVVEAVAAGRKAAAAIARFLGAGRTA